MSRLPSEPFNVQLLMEDVNEKLKLLNYERDLLSKHSDLKPLNRVYFAQTGKASEQFPYFAHLAQFLFRKCGLSEVFDWNEFDDPTSISAAILDQLKRLNFPFDFPASKYRHGSGEAVVATLDYLCDRALQARRIVIQAPIYTSASVNEGDEQGVTTQDGDEDEDVEEEKADEEITEEDGDNGEVHNSLASPKSIGRSEWGDQTRPQEILISKVDPNEWKLELERVEPQLKLKAATSGKEWRTHLDAAAKHNSAMTEVFPLARSALEKMAGNLKKAIEKIQSQERRINKDHETICQEFRGRKEVQDNHDREFTNVTEEINQLKVKFESTEEEIRKIKSQMNEKNNTMTDTQPLRKISSALAAIKKEISSMELRIGVLSQAQTMWRLKQQALKMSQSGGRASAGQTRTRENNTRGKFE
jgi:estrogen-related receptor beta like 1